MFKSVNPFNNEVLQDFDPYNDDKINQILDSSRKGFEGWKRKPISERSELFNQLASVLKNKSEVLAKEITLEMGKTLKEAKSEVEKCAWVCEYFAEQAREFLQDEEIGSDADKSLVRYEPLGAVLAIMPWNFPYWQVFRFAAPSLMAGNVALLKHAPNVSMCSLTIEEIFSDAGFPDGVFQSLIIEVDKIEDILERDIVKAATLTGSEMAGASLASLAGKNIKKTVLELGGSDPFIVLADADLDKAVEVCVKSRMQNAGQSCIAAKRLIVEEKVADEFVNKLNEKISNLSQGDPMDDNVDMGPMARIDLAENLERQLEESLEAGAELVTGGKREDCHFEPTLIKGVKPGMPAFDEETFGPLAAVILARDEQHAVSLANETNYGLGASIWSRDIEKAEKITLEINSGGVFVNSMVKSDPRLPFGGIKRSGYGRELSKLGIREFVNAKTVYIER